MKVNILGFRIEISRTHSQRVALAHKVDKEAQGLFPDAYGMCPKIARRETYRKLICFSNGEQKPSVVCQAWVESMFADCGNGPVLE